MHQHPFLLQSLLDEADSFLNVLQQVAANRVFDLNLLVNVLVLVLHLKLSAHHQNMGDPDDI